MSERNVFIYWVGKENSLILILRQLMYLHSYSGKGFTFHFITEKNIHEYLPEIPSYFHSFIPAHQADYVRVHVLCEYGGIWMDSDTLVMHSLDDIFDTMQQKEKDGFFILEDNRLLCNGVFASVARTPLMMEWKRRMQDVLNKKQHKIAWTDIGSSLLNSIYRVNRELYDKYTILKGLDNVYPVYWKQCVEQFIESPYENYKHILREYQPFIVLCNHVYKRLESNTPQQIYSEKTPLNYFLQTSFERLELEDYDFIEIGTSNFDTLLQTAGERTKGISVDAVKYYIDSLPDKPNVKKIHVGVSDTRGEMDLYYIPEHIIREHHLPEWFRGCNCIRQYHPLHIKHNVQHLCVVEKVRVIPAEELFYEHRVRKVGFLKIDTEGHDCVILRRLFKYFQCIPRSFHPSKIMFESNENAIKEEVDHIVELYTSIGYVCQTRGYDTVLVLSEQ